LITPFFRNNNTGSLINDQQQQPVIMASTTNNTNSPSSLVVPVLNLSIISLASSQHQRQHQQQQQQQEPNLPFSFSEMRPSSYHTHSQQYTYLHHQQEVHQQAQPGLSQEQYHHHQQHQPQQQQQQQRHVHSVVQSFAADGGGGEQRHQMQQPLTVRSEINVIDPLRRSLSGGDINVNVTDVLPSLDVERDLEESYQQNAIFDEDADDLKQNGNDLQHPNSNDTVVNVDDEGGFDFSDTEGTVPDIAISGNIIPMAPMHGFPNEEEVEFDTHIDVADVDDDDKIIDDMLKNRNLLLNATTSMTTTAPMTHNNNDNNASHDNHNTNNAHSSSSSSLSTSASASASASALTETETETEATPTATATSTTMTTTAEIKEVKFRAYQAENWTEKFEELLQFRDVNGHCLVPNCHPENPVLAQWTKRQRYQYKLKMDGKRSTITGERIRALDEAGFVWDSHKAVWAERLEELKDFSKEFGHCNVPSRYETNHQLAIWVKRQRRQWKNKMDSQANCMTDSRQEQLEALRFVWDMKKKETKTKPTKRAKMMMK